MSKSPRIVLWAIPAILLITRTLVSGEVNKRDYCPEIQPYVAFLKTVHEHPVDYIMRLFDEHDLVIICERIHPEMTQYDFLLKLATDLRFIDSVGNIFTEIGSSGYQDRLNRYLKHPGGRDSESDKELNEIYRDFYDKGIWEKSNLYDWLKKIHDANESLDSARRISVYPSDKAFSYDGMTKELYEQYDEPNRDSSIAANIVSKFKDLKETNPRAKALVIMNFRHAFNRHIRRSKNKTIKNVGGYLFDAFPGKVANVMLNTVIARQVADTVSFSALQEGRWDAAFAVLGNPQVGFDFAGSPFGADHCDYLYFIDHDLSYQDLFTGFIFYNPIEQHKLAFGVPAIFDGDFEDTLEQRIENLFGVDSTYSSRYISFAKEQNLMTYGTMDKHFEISCSNSTIDPEIAHWLNCGNAK